MITVAVTRADVRKKKILDAVNQMKFADDPYAGEFGISVDSQMAKIEGKTRFYTQNPILC